MWVAKLQKYQTLSTLATLSHGHPFGEPCNLTDFPYIHLSWDPFAGDVGLYKVAGSTSTDAKNIAKECHGVSPEIHLNYGQKYYFVQSDESNWYHPVGFAYEVGGAHNTCACPADAPDCPNIAIEGECPELGGEGVNGTMSTIQYITKTVAVKGPPEDESGFGLDAYEPFFFYPFGDWYEGCGGADAPCHVEFEVSDPSQFPEGKPRKYVYYFCHIHPGMSAKIVLENLPNPDGAIVPYCADGSIPGCPEPTAPDPSDFDEKCGTWNTGPYAPGAAQYPHCKGKKFLCSDEQNSEAPENDFNECLEAIDCQMHREMAVSAEGATMAATFLRQMIPHHANAVAMAKTLLKMDPGTVDTEFDGEKTLKGLLMDIINVQNFQIAVMEGLLEAEEIKSSGGGMCYPTCPDHMSKGPSAGRNMLFSSMPEC